MCMALSCLIASTPGFPDQSYSNLNIANGLEGFSRLFIGRTLIRGEGQPNLKHHQCHREGHMHLSRYCVVSISECWASVDVINKIAHRAFTSQRQTDYFTMILTLWMKEWSWIYKATIRSIRNSVFCCLQRLPTSSTISSLFFNHCLISSPWKCLVRCVHTHTHQSLHPCCARRE